MIFLEDDEPLFRSNDTTIVDAFTLAAVIRDQSGKKGVERRRVLGAEPVLGPYVQHEVLKIIGRLALSGAPPGVCRCVVTDIYRILDIAGSALREGYRGMLAEFMPAADADAGSDKPSNHTKEGADAE